MYLLMQNCYHLLSTYRIDRQSSLIKRLGAIFIQTQIVLYVIQKMNNFINNIAIFIN